MPSTCLTRVCFFTATALLCLISCTPEFANARKHDMDSRFGYDNHESGRRSDRRQRKSIKATLKDEEISKSANVSIISVKLEKGRYKGKVEDVLDTKVAFFLGMRYAKAPTGKLRFKKSEPVEKWGGTQYALEYPNTCYQWRDNTFGRAYPGTEMWNANTELSEDCLFLNVWTPLSPDFSGRKIPADWSSLPVMVWIYGGGFYSGTSSLDVYQGQWLAASEEVVVVSMNYRVAAFGFLTMGNDDAPGNTGLWDQLEALRWVKQNIHHFRGDPSRVTIFGESAGAASVSLHILSEKSKGLFRNAIIQSASAFSPWAIISMDIMRNRAMKLAGLMNCNSKSNDTKKAEKDMMECMYEANAQEMVDEEIAMEDLGTARFQNAAVIDEDFLTSEAIDSLKKGTFRTDVNIMGGFNANEGNYFLVYSTQGFKDIHNNVPITYHQYREGLKKSLWGYPWRPTNEDKISVHNENDITIDAIDFQYMDFEDRSQCQRHNGKFVCPEENSDNNQTPPDYKYTLDQISGDTNFVCPVLKFMRVTGSPSDSSVGSGEGLLSARKSHKPESQKQFMYRFLRRSSQTPWPEWMGTLHGYEIEFAFGLPMNKNINYTDQERELSKLMAKYWANFAKSGNPNIPADSSLPEWPEYTKEREETIVLYIDESSEPVAKASVEKGPKSKDCSFWNDYYSVLQKNVAQLGYIEGKTCPEQTRAGAASSYPFSSIILACCSIFTLCFMHLPDFF